MDDPTSEWQAITWDELKQMRSQPPAGKWDRIMDRLGVGEILRRTVMDQDAAHRLKIALGKAAATRGMKLHYEEIEETETQPRQLVVYRIDAPEASPAAEQSPRRVRRKRAQP